MAPPAVEVDDMDSSSPHEEYATPAGISPTTTGHETSPEQTTIPDADVKVHHTHTHTHINTHTNTHNHPSEQARSSNESLQNTAREPSVNDEVTIVTLDVSSSHFPLSGTPNGVGHAPSTLGSSDVPFAASLASSLPHNRILAPGKPTTSPSPAPQTSTSKSIKLEKEVASLKEAIKDASPDALHKLLRDEWRSFLYTPLEEDHVTYILRACLKNSTQTVVERGVREVFSKPEHQPAIISNALRCVTTKQLIQQLPTHILTEVADRTLVHATAPALIHRLPHHVFKQIVAHQLGVLSARDLVNMLAEAGRLGYSMDDIVDEETEHVQPPPIPQEDVQGDAMNGVQYSQPGTDHTADPLLAEQEKNRKAEIQQSQQAFIQRQQGYPGQNYAQLPAPAPIPIPQTRAVLGPCSTCGFTSPTRGGQAYHAHKMPCENTTKGTPPGGWHFRCNNCGQNFTQGGGKQYHDLKGVCSSGKFADPTSNYVPPPVRAPPRPNFTTAPRASPHRASPILPPPRAGDHQIPRPPLHTPSAPAYTPQVRIPNPSPQEIIRAVDPNARVDPSKLPPEKLAEMEKIIAAEDIRYEKELADLDDNADLGEEAKEKRKASAKANNATKKSQIRKKFGVSLRLREKDRKAAQNAPLSSPASTSTSRAGPTYSSPHNSQIPSHVSSPAPRFSPINAPSPPTAGPSGPAPILPPQYTQPQNGSASNSRRPDARMSGFGILKTTATSLPQGYQNHPYPPPPKRQRTSSVETSGPPLMKNWIPPSSKIPYATPNGPGPAALPGFSMMEVSSQDAAGRYPRKKIPVAGAQAKWEQLQPRSSSTTSPPNPTTGLPNNSSTAPVRAKSNTVHEAIEIDSSSDTDAAEPSLGEQNRRGARVLDELMTDRDLPLPSTEDTSSEAASRLTSSGSGGARGKFMARRGGRQS